MKGDFSKWGFDPADNFTGVLYQQGRVFSDQDGNAETQIGDYLRTILTQDALGAEVAAVPATAADSFKVAQAASDGTNVRITLKPGRLWADGLPVILPGTADVTLKASYLGPPIQSPQPVVSSIAASVRDAVVLEVWEEAFSGYQDPLDLIEPALGGPDTTKRVQAAYALRLLRLNAGDECGNLAARLRDNFATKGKLTVTPAPTTTISGDCPVPAGGGYSGFEHYLYRIEIAEPTSGGQPRFKWSPFNGGLVGRGVYTSIGTVAISANNQMINFSGLTTFYLEALKFDADFGYWRVVLNADATLTQNDTLSLTNVSGTWPATSPNSGFFRLWNGIRLISDFRTGLPQPNELKDGIRLAFEAPDTGKYLPGDYWAFPVRASGVAIDAAWIAANWPANSPPHGIHYHRVPLAILSWDGAPPVTITAAAGQIEDCRRVFDPLTELRGCCIEVKPGDDIHRAVAKVLEAGGGCLCLLPGEHVLRRPIDLTGRNSIRISGFGPSSRLLIPERIGTTPPFVLTNARDVTFESFLVVNRTAQPLWVCQGTQRLRVRNVFAISSLEARNQSLFALNGSCHSWCLENNVFVGAAGLSGRLLAMSLIVGNVWVGARRGIDLLYAKGLQIERNEFLGIHSGFVKDLEALLGDTKSSGRSSPISAKELAYRVVSAPKAAVAPQYIAIELNSAVDIDVVDNVFYGAVGINLEVTENCLVHRNRFLSTVAAAACGIVHGLRFSENRVGVKPGGATGQKAVVCETGLVILADAIECQIVDNAFENVKQGVAFESDPGNKKAIARDFSANLFTLSKVTTDSAKKLLEDSEVRVKEVSDRRLLLNSTFFRLGRCERTLIQGNRFHASEVAIEWSGTKQILDFRIVNNAFIGCQDVAIQIEPDDRILFLADPVDTTVRLIEKNRFDIYSGAVRATIGAVRVEKNDMRINAPVWTPLLPISLLTAAAENIYNSASFTKAVKVVDIPLARMMAMEVTSTVEENPNVVNSAGFSKDVGDTILKTHKPKKSDALADKAFVMKTFGDLAANDYLATLSNALLGRWKFNTEGFVINLAGIQNRVVHNRMHGSNPQRPGGVLFHTVSGEIRDNEIVVQGTALLLNGKLSLSSGYQGAEIVGNSLAALGVPGSKTAVYALAIPSLSPGNLFITNNLFKGSVMIGGDPLAAQGFSKKDIVQNPGMITSYHAMKYDMATYAVSTLGKVFAGKAGNVGVVEPPGIVIPVWLTDPHANRPVVQFCQNRVIQGWVGIFQALSGAYWSRALLQSQAGQVLIANVANNVLDYGGSVVGYELVIMGNYSQLGLKYRAGGRVEAVANIPTAVNF